jgi:hypothetical protein
MSEQVLVTGVSGFIDKRAALALLRRGYHVRARMPRALQLAAAALGIAVGAEQAMGQDVGWERFSAELEIGPAWQSRNDVQIPNTQEGTRFSLVDLVGHGPWPAGRLYLTWNISERHSLRALLAPLSYTDPGIFDEPIDFAGETFEPGVPTDATYKFNSWLLGYRFRLLRSDHFRWWIGFTAKIRDAKIRLEQPGTAAEDTDVGFVPLLNLGLEYRFAGSWFALLDVDGLAGGPGRAIDGAVKIGYDLSRRWSFAAGYRAVEGGVDIEEVYNFAWFNYALASASFRF